MKITYTVEQMQTLAGHLNMLASLNQNDGILKCKLITLCCNIIDNPIEQVDESEVEDEPTNSTDKTDTKHKQLDTK